MEADGGVFLEPALVLLMRVEIVEDDVKLTIREGGNEAVSEAEELDTTAPLGMRRDDPSGGVLRALRTSSVKSAAKSSRTSPAVRCCRPAA
jgi:hypothetical protein